MNTEKYIAYIKGGINITSNPKLGRRCILSAFFLIVLGIAAAGSDIEIFHKVILGLMVAIFLITSLAYFITFFVNKSVKGLLLEQLMIAFSWFLQLFLINMMTFYNLFGWQWKFVFFFLPLLLFPVIVGLIDAYFLKSNRSVSPKKTFIWKTCVGGIPTILLSRYIVNHLASQLNQNTVELIMLSLAYFVNLLFSLGLLNIQRIYYEHKFKPLSDSFMVNHGSQNQ